MENISINAKNSYSTPIVHCHYNNNQKQKINNLLYAIQNDNTDLMQQIIDADMSLLQWIGGGDAHDQGGSLLHEAAFSGNFEAVKILCEKYNLNIGFKDYSLFTPAAVAARMLYGEDYTDDVKNSLTREDVEESEYLNIVIYLNNKAIDEDNLDVLNAVGFDGRTTVDIADEHNLPNLA